ncbi:ArsR/SmtB family transcription factor [Loigolactobacillus bifermentans]|uniref:HTH arsR-type domain-containing protein n=1 Tax=Loigolactobacillus bifermentans DSM 20003 TaxID=1423726 RepID=A0A0R1GP87_9LACO|nr:metalloregulator ArsR/SmtB family transcription factor [Loigolactobacillus bifermentans]KRK33146.1 hypothetical protein FC07_GL001400 [Loigolactobacillus bifermentans DSM 20003]QGG60498.1 metalloregulator ArsR/SmtB family transcription factor [Loigolactobacillus bifermentans]
MADLSKIKAEFTASSQFLVALGDEKRQAILLALMADRACQGVRVSELTAATQLSRPAISHHLKILKEAKLVDYRREGTKNFYYIVHETAAVQQLQQLLQDVVQVMTAEAN